MKGGEQWIIAVLANGVVTRSKSRRADVANVQIQSNPIMRNSEIVVDLSRRKVWQERLKRKRRFPAEVFLHFQRKNDIFYGLKQIQRRNGLFPACA